MLNLISISCLLSCSQGEDLIQESLMNLAFSPTHSVFSAHYKKFHHMKLRALWKVGLILMTCASENHWGKNASE